MHVRNLLISAAILALSASGAQAALVSKVVTFSANTFQIGSGVDPAPVDPVTGSFTITLDDATDYTDTTAGIALNSLNIVLGSALSFNYDHTTDRLEVGGISGGANIIFFNPSTNDFWLFINDFLSGTPLFDQVGYTQTAVSSNNLFYTVNQTGSVTVQDAPSPVPLPAALPLLGGALLGMGAFGIRHRRRASA